ncbi:transport and Golgi organization protein 1 [Frankliniella occidentalis]|uniref:Transport and Golgi organization protein 1 n=1 Tax=Frankliniella occidentalis TaxID=133901 RepID=A0A9C6U2H0_FRAOC|nr:transport and Golgi organization protein 1 [Frankliniella occidentalis]
MKEFTAIWLIFLYFLCILISQNDARLPNEIQCGDNDCSTPISRAKTLLRYTSGLEGGVSFPKGIEVEVFSKRDDAWGIKVGDKIGFAPKTFVREIKVYIPTKSLVTVVQDVSAKTVQVDSTQNESADVALEKTKEIPSVLGSLLSFPSMASAESVEGQQQNLPTPSSPQSEVVDGTTIWLDPMPPMQAAEQPASPNVSDNKGQESSTTSENIQDDVKTPEVSESADSKIDVPTTHNSEEVSETPTTPVPSDNFVTPPYDGGEFEPEKQEVTTDIPEASPEKPTEPAADQSSRDESIETTTEPATDETTESQDIQPTQAGLMSNLWNTMFNSGDGTEENSQENDGEEDDEDGEDVDEGDDGEDGSAEEESNPNSSEPATPTSPLPVGQADISSNVIVENLQKTSASPDDLADSFAQTQYIQQSENVRLARQVGPGSEELISEEVPEDQVEKVSEENLESVSPPNILDSREEKQSIDSNSNAQDGNTSQVVDEKPEQEKINELLNNEEPKQKEESGQQQETELEDGQWKEEQLEAEQKLKQEEEQKRLQEEEEQKKLQKEEEQKRLQEEEQKRLEEEEQKRLQEEEQKRLEEEEQKRLQGVEQKRLQEEEEEQKRLQEEEQKRLQEVEQKRLQEEEEEQKRLQEVEQKRLQEEEEEQKRLQEEEWKRLQEVEQNRLQEEEKRKLEEDARMREEENQKLFEAEQAMIRENEAKQRIREEQMKREKEDAKRLQDSQKLRESLEKEREQFKLSQDIQQPVPEVNNILSEQNLTSSNKLEQDIVKSEQDASNSEPETSEGIFSWISGLFGSNVETVSNGSDQEPVLPPQSETLQQSSSPASHVSHSHHHENPLERQHEHPPVWSSAHQTMCSASEAGCDMKVESDSEHEASSLFLGLQMPSLDVILLRLVATAVSLLIGAVSFYFLRKKHVDSSLVARINELEKQLLVASKEAVILREEVSTVDTSANSEEVNLLQEELESCRLVRADLEEQVSTLERELEEATETGIELNKLLSETLEASKGKAHAGLADSVERLQRQLDGQKDRVDSLTRSLKSTSAENESLKSLLAENKEKISALEAELSAAADIANNIRREKEEANVLAAQELQQVQSRLEDALSSKVLEESRLHSELSALKLKHETLRAALSMRDAEVKALQDTLKELDSNGGKADQLLDVSKVKAELEEAKKDKATFEEKYNVEEKARKDLEDRLANISETLKKLEGNVEIAEKNKEEAETRLAVLSNYFKEKEEQLQKELGLKEAIVAQHRGDESTVVKHLQSLQEEVSTYRAQNESLKKEILDQERDFKAQMATLEKKAHDNWMTARQAERRLEDSRHEAAQLRNRLTLVEKHNADPNARLDANGEGGVASPVMMMPLPPLGDMETPPPLPPFMFSPPPYPPPFMPPPLPPHPMGRPPPLGRMSSPPPPLGQFSPPPPPYDRLDRSSRSPSPPPHRYHHRSPPPPHQWDPPPSSFRPVPKPSPKKPSEHRDHKGSIHNSGHSNESMDKSREHV